jgi:hypothetical protein
MGIYIISFNQSSSGPEFSVVVAESALEARKLVNDLVDEWDSIHVTGIQEVDLNKIGIVKTGHYCC